MDNYTFYVYADDVKDGITLDTAIELYKNTNVCTSYKALGVTKNRHYSCDLVNNLGQNNTDKISNDYTVMAEFKDDNIIKVNVLNRLKDEFLK